MSLFICCGLFSLKLQGRPVRERDIAKIREGEAHNTMVGVEEELELSSADPALTEADMQLGSYVMVIMVVFYFAGFFILQAVIEEDEENRTLWVRSTLKTFF